MPSIWAKMEDNASEKESLAAGRMIWNWFT